MALRWLTAGESHGPALVAVLDGVPAGVALNSADVSRELARRRLGYGRGARMAFEQDEVELVGGVRHGVTLGMGDILRSRKVLLLVSGAHKREAMERLREPRVSTAFPASLLWLHGDAVCLCDREAAEPPDPDVGHHAAASRRICPAQAVRAQQGSRRCRAPRPGAAAEDREMV